MLHLLDTSQRPPQRDDSTYFSSGGARDHINAMGMPDDGTHYDYEDHLRSMGGGTFVAKVCSAHCSSALLTIQALLHISNNWRYMFLRHLPSLQRTKQHTGYPLTPVHAAYAVAEQSGKVGSVPLPDAQAVVLPAEALPSEGGEVERHLASITISERVMEPDMRAIVTGEVCILLLFTSAYMYTFIIC
jgi:hypothetical protein